MAFHLDTSIFSNSPRIPCYYIVADVYYDSDSVDCQLSVSGFPTEASIFIWSGITIIYTTIVSTSAMFPNNEMNENTLFKMELLLS